MLGWSTCTSPVLEWASCSAALVLATFLISEDFWELLIIYNLNSAALHMWVNTAFLFYFSRYGRKVTIVLANMMNFIMGIAVAVVPNYTCILLFRAFLGFSMKGSWMSSYVLSNDTSSLTPFFYRSSNDAALSNNTWLANFGNTFITLRSKLKSRWLKEVS